MPTPQLCCSTQRNATASPARLAAKAGDILGWMKLRLCSCLSTVPFATGPKRAMGHVLGAEKIYILIRGAEADEATGRPRRFNPVNPCPRGVPGVAQGR